MKKLVLDRETLKVLNAPQARKVQGGKARPITELANCTEGSPCTSGCTTGSRNCTPMTYLRGC